jgi:hypothetical protein
MSKLPHKPRPEMFVSNLGVRTTIADLIAGFIAILTSAGLIALASLIRTTCCAWTMPSVESKTMQSRAKLDHRNIVLRIFGLLLQNIVDMDRNEE